MTQIFKPRSNALFRGILLGGAILPMIAALTLAALRDSTYDTEIGTAYPQPVPFSHKHHVSGLGIDCRYCHATVEKAASAGMPTSHTCLSCHSQIWNQAPMLAPVRESARTGTPLAWNRVNRLPLHVYFHHGIHVQKGVSCTSCHGAIDQMPLTRKTRPFTMKDCLSCHRSLGSKLANPSRLTDCNTCHR